MELIRLAGVVKDYPLDAGPFRALDHVDLTVEKGESVAVMGPSGSGKSTLMNIVGCLDTPTEGSYLLEGEDVSSLSRDRLAETRNRKMGFVFQGFNLLRRTSAVENVELPLLYAGIPHRERHERALAALVAVGLGEKGDSFPNQLSGGQQQRVAIARALVNGAPLLLADEPTGNLDTRTSAEIMELFTRLNLEQGITLVVVTHEADIAAYSRRVVRFSDGRIVSDQRRNA